METQTLSFVRTVVKTTYYRAEMTYEDFCKTKKMKKYSDDEKKKIWTALVEEHDGEIDAGEGEDDADEDCEWTEFLDDFKNEVDKVIESLDAEKQQALEKEKARCLEIYKLQEEMDKLKARLAQLDA